MYQSTCICTLSSAFLLFTVDERSLRTYLRHTPPLVPCSRVLPLHHHFLHSLLNHPHQRQIYCNFSHLNKYFLIHSLVTALFLHLLYSKTPHKNCLNSLYLPLFPQLTLTIVYNIPLRLLFLRLSVT